MQYRSWLQFAEGVPVVKHNQPQGALKMTRGRDGENIMVVVGLQEEELEQEVYRHRQAIL